MLNELLNIFRADNPLHAMGENFTDMLKLTYRMTLSAGEIYFGGKAAPPEDRTHIYEDDIRVNKLGARHPEEGRCPSLHQRELAGRSLLTLCS